MSDQPLAYISDRCRIARKRLPDYRASASGYGRKIPTSYVIQRPGEAVWRRVYITCYSNSGTCWIQVGGKDFGEVVPDYRVPESVPAWPDSVNVWQDLGERMTSERLGPALYFRSKYLTEIADGDRTRLIRLLEDLPVPHTAERLHYFTFGGMDCRAYWDLGVWHVTTQKDQEYRHTATALQIRRAAEIAVGRP